MRTRQVRVRGTGGVETLAVRRAVVAVGLVAATLALFPAASSAGPRILPARVGGTVAPDGLSASDGQRTLRVAQARDLAPTTQGIGVAGSGYDESKGIYVAFCVVTPPDRAPSPCGGGIDMDGSNGASAWISSNPPDYGVGLAQPYGAGGSFSVTVSVTPVIAAGFDCRQIQCAIVTRNDHVRTGDRSQDIVIPVTFGSGTAEPPPPTTAPPGTTAPPTTLAPPPPPTTTTPEAAPPTTVSDDGLTATSGDREVTLSVARDLDPEGDEITVAGTGFDTAKGVLVTLCRASASPTEAPGPCLAGSTPDASRWVSSSPPEYAADLVEPYGDGGTFEVTIDVAPEIDDEVDCREVDCAVVIRRDDTDPADRTLDMAVPVRFGEPEEQATPTTTAPAADSAAPVTTAAPPADEGSSSPLPWILLVLLVIAIAGVTVFLLLSRKGKAGSPATPTTDPAPTDPTPTDPAPGTAS